MSCAPRIESGSGSPISITDKRLSRENGNRCAADNDERKNHRDPQCKADMCSGRVKSELVKCILAPATAEGTTDNEREEKRGQQRDHCTGKGQVDQNWHVSGLCDQSWNDRFSQRIGEYKASKETKGSSDPDGIQHCICRTCELTEQCSA